MQITTWYDIKSELGINHTQLRMALYSGRIPKPNCGFAWRTESIRFYLDHWAKQIAERKPAEDRYGAYPRHQR